MSTEGIVRPAPLYLLSGGPGSRRAEGDPVLARALASSGVTRPLVAYIGAANGDNRPFFLALSAYLRLCGAGEVTLAPLAGRQARVEKAQAIIQAADLVYMSGGDVETGMRVLQERQILPFLRELYESGKPFFGISAGSIMLARQWVRWEDPNDDSTASLFPCMGFAPIICDTHGEAEGWEELRALLCLEAEGTLGYGIPTGAALCVYPDGRLEALGRPVHVFVKKRGRVVRREDVNGPQT